MTTHPTPTVPTPEPYAWAFLPIDASQALDQQAALEHLVRLLAQDHHGVLHTLVADLRAEATNTLPDDQGEAEALAALADLLAAECPR